MRLIHFAFYEKNDDPDEQTHVYRFGIQSCIGDVITRRVFAELSDRHDYMPMIANIEYLH